MQVLSQMYGGNRVVFTVRYNCLLVTPLLSIPSQATGIWSLVPSSNFPRIPTSILSTANFSSSSQFLRPCLPSIAVSRDGPNGICVTNQPHAKPVLKFKESISTFPLQEGSLQNDNEYCQCKHSQTSPSQDPRHHNIRLKKLILPALLVLLTLGGLLV